MTTLKTSSPYSSENTSRRAQAVHTGNALSLFANTKSRRYLYAGMMFPSSAVAGREILKLDDRVEQGS